MKSKKWKDKTILMKKVQKKILLVLTTWSMVKHTHIGCDQVWEDATDLKFTKKNSGKVHIEIRSSR